MQEWLEKCYNRVNNFHSQAQDRDDDKKEKFYEKLMTKVELLQALFRDPKSTAHNPKVRKFDEDSRDVAAESPAKKTKHDNVKTVDGEQEPRFRQNSSHICGDTEPYDFTGGDD